MTIRELVKELERFDPKREVRFVPKKFCAQGYPEWRSAEAFAKDGGFALIELMDEQE